MINSLNSNLNLTDSLPIPNSYKSDDFFEINLFNEEINYNLLCFNNYVSERMKLLAKKKFRSNEYFLEEETKSEQIYHNIKEVFSLNQEFEEIEDENGMNNISINRTQNNMFVIRIINTPGRRRVNENNKKIHGKYDYDNVITKVQVHYIKFIINLANDITRFILGINKDLSFIDIDYQIKKNVKFDNFQFLKSLKIKEILIKPITKKFRNYKTDHNETVYNKVISAISTKNSDTLTKEGKNNTLVNVNQSKGSELLSEFFNMNYLTLFKIYYNECEYLDKIIIKEKAINLTKKTKSFYELIKNRNNIMKNLIIKYTRRAYFGEVEAKENNNLSPKYNFKINY